MSVFINFLLVDSVRLFVCCKYSFAFKWNLQLGIFVLFSDGQKKIFNWIPSWALSAEIFFLKWVGDIFCVINLSLFSICRCLLVISYISHPAYLLFLSLVQHKTIDSVLARGERLDSLVEKSSDLSAASQVQTIIVNDYEFATAHSLIVHLIFICV